jgi:hypothetical protein
MQNVAPGIIGTDALVAKALAAAPKTRGAAECFS